jgi:hypothetical protein
MTAFVFLPLPSGLMSQNKGTKANNMTLAAFLPFLTIESSSSRSVWLRKILYFDAVATSLSGCHQYTGLTEKSMLQGTMGTMTTRQIFVKP